jgi:hypothetical protein
MHTSQRSVHGALAGKTELSPILYDGTNTSQQVHDAAACRRGDDLICKHSTTHLHPCQEHSKNFSYFSINAAYQKNFLTETPKGKKKKLFDIFFIGIPYFVPMCYNNHKAAYGHNITGERYGLKNSGRL